MSSREERGNKRERGERNREREGERDRERVREGQREQKSRLWFRQVIDMFFKMQADQSGRRRRWSSEGGSGQR